MFVGAASLDVAATVVPKNYLKHAQYANDHFSKLTRSILAQVCMHYPIIRNSNDTDIVDSD